MELGAMFPTPSPRAASFVAFIGLFATVSAFGLTVTQTKLGNIFLAGEPVGFALNGTGSSVDWSVKNYFGQTVAGGNVALSSGAASLQPAVTLPGYYELTLTEKSGSTVIGTFPTTFAVVAPVALSPDSPFGAMTHCAQFDNPEIFGLLARGNISHFRDEQYWANIETSPGVYSFPTKFTGYMSAAAAKGLTPLIALDWSHPLYDYSSGQFTAPHTDNGRLGYANYSRAVLNQYGSQVPAVEVWNEYNGGTFVQGPATANKPLYYYQMLRKTHEVVKAVHPGVKILAGATVPVAHGFLKNVFAQGAMPYLDGISIHPYRTSPQGIELDIRELGELIKTYNGGQPKPIWATEFSKNIATAGDRPSGAPYLVQISVMMRNAGVERLYYYLTKENGSFPYRGLLRTSTAPEGKYVPNPAFPAYATLAAQTHDWIPSGRVTTGLKTTTYAYAMTKTGQSRHVLWAASPATVELSAAQPLTLVDIMGVSSTLTPQNGKVTLSLTENPCYVTGAITAFQDVNNLVLADSACDYDKTQTSHGWSYGYATLGSGASYQATNFQPLTWAIWKSDTYRWKKASGDYPFVTVDAMHPGGSDWAIKRWQSATAGKIRIEGTASIGANSVDGVSLRIFVDGSEVMTEILQAGESVEFSLLEVDVAAGSKVDFAITKIADTTNDATSLDVRIFDVSAIAPLGTPTSLTAQGVANNRVWLFWQDNAENETGYQIEWKWGTQPFTLVTTTAPNATSFYHNASMAEGIPYTYRVRAVSGTSASAYSNTATTTDNSSGSLTQYALTVNGGSGGGNYNAATIVPVQAAPPPPGQVFAGWTGGSGALANPSAASTNLAMPTGAVTITATYQNAVPNAPTNLTAQGVANNRVWLFWQDNASDETGYAIEWKWGSQPYTLVTTTGPNANSFYHNSSMAEGISYTYRVRAVSGTSASAYSNTASTTDNSAGSLTQYALTVNGGSGGGNYNATTIVPVQAAPPPPGQVFAGWAGGTVALTSPNATTTVIMPTGPVTITATYQ